VIGYEAYHPFGTTAYQAVDKDIVAAAKRYRYTGMERDEESGLEYHGARYYAPWLGRWIAADAHAEMLDGNRYAYVKNNPIVNRDSNGMFEEPTHGILTYRLALAAGFPPKDAARVAIASAAMDHDASTRPAAPEEVPFFIRIPQTIRYHFPGYSAALEGVNRDIAEQRSGARRNDDLERFGQHLHTLEDVGFTDAPGPHMRHDPGRPAGRILGPTLGIVGMTSSSIALIAYIPAIRDGNMKAGGWVVFALLMGSGVYFMVLGFATSDMGHPSYTTERGEQSHSFSHVADQASQDPRANTTEMLKVYERMKAYAQARYGARAGTPDDAAAAAAIRQDVEADNSCLVSNFANASPPTRGDQSPASYSDILATRSKARGPKWDAQHMDVSNPVNRGDWQYSTGIHQCR
jgi:RHS repeat-associated protein